MKQLSMMMLAVVLTAGCSTPQRTAYQAVGAVGITARAAMEGWAAWARTGKADADEIKTVERAYRAYAVAYRLAIDAGKASVGGADAGALATAVRVVAACEADVVKLVMQFLPADVAGKLKGE